MTLSVQMRRPVVIVNDDAGIIARGLELLEAFGAEVNTRNVVSLADLRALSSAQFPAASLLSGTAVTPYVWSGANLSAAITAGDPRFVAANADLTGASGAWTLASPVIANAADIGVITGTVSDAVALTNAQRINAWLAGGEGRVFDWRADLIGFAETIRLGRRGNGIIGVPGARVFGTAVAGARGKWQGASGGIMVLARNTASVSTLDAPSIEGLALDGSALAARGFDYSAVQKPIGKNLHVSNLLDDASSYAFVFGHNEAQTTGVNGCYGGTFQALTCSLGGNANGFLFTGKANTSGSNVTFCQFSYCHATVGNGFSFVFQKGDDNSFHQIGVSRLAGGTNGDVLFNTSAGQGAHWVGNKIFNMNMSVSDGAPMRIIVNDFRTMGNLISYNGVDFSPTLLLLNGALLEHNEWIFAGQPDYAGGFTIEPMQNLLPLPNENSTNPKILDWYEEGIVAEPAFSFGGASVGMAFGARSLNWTRIGNRVFFNGTITLTARGTSTGAARITGLPFTAQSGVGTFSISFYQNFASAITPFASVTGTTIQLRRFGAASSADMTHADFTDTTRIDFGGSYQVA
jgi:hypothetical protein